MRPVGTLDDYKKVESKGALVVAEINEQLPRSTWTKEEVNVLIQMRSKNYSRAEIAVALGKKEKTLNNFLAKNASKLGLKMQQREPAISDKEWQGCVPLGHWIITKKWSQK